MLKYIELKTGFNHNGPAWVGLTSLSKTGKTIYFNGKAFKRIASGGVAGNYYDLESGDEYWISGIKKNGFDRHWAGSGKIKIEAAAVKKYLNVVSGNQIDQKKFEVIEIVTTTPNKKLHEIENEKL